MVNCIFSYYISESEISINELPQKYEFGKYIIYTDVQTPCDIVCFENRSCFLFGYAVDVISGEYEKLAQRMLTETKDLESFIEYEKRLGGKYLLIYKDDSGYYLLGDATCSIPIYYGIGLNEFVCCGNPMYIANKFSLSTDKVLQEIREGGEISQAMPYDITEYKEIKQLIPNHYLDFENQKSIRFLNSVKKQKTIRVEDATAIVLSRIQNLAKFFTQKFTLYCPITGGKDSRVVLASLMSVFQEPFIAYTIKHKHHRGDEADLTIPQKLADTISLRYECLEDIELFEKQILEMDELLGKDRYSLRTLTIAQTINNRFYDGGIVNGDIIGQVGKCSLHRDIPAIFATPGYFRCKLHNYSKGSKKQLKLWLNEIKESGEKVNPFDLFSVENRMGRWAGQENLIYNLVGQLYLNIFNSRSIIYVWTAVKREARKKSLLHKALIEELNKNLLAIPFGGDEGIFVKISKANGLFYYLSSYLKYYIGKRNYKKGK